MKFGCDVVIGGISKQFLSISQRDKELWRIAVNGSGSGVDDVSIFLFEYACSSIR